jgi:DNA-binding NtrC family response regulator
MRIKSLKESEREHLLNVLEKTHWDLEKTSRLLKISLQRVKSKIKAYGIRRSDPQGSSTGMSNNGLTKGEQV